jgi:GNAT superfamily N-acetyltransferase
MYGLRFFKSSDRDFWFKLHHEAYRPRVEPIWGWDADAQARFAAAELEKLYSGQFIITQGGQDVGYLSYDWQNNPACLYLSNIILTPASRSQGLGASILGDLMAMAQRFGKPMRLRTFENNPAKSFYERLGFVVYEHNPADHHYYLEWKP